ncbi:MAG: hypothetical protein U0W24_22500 [Bacteroidales bacterium]
MKNLFNFRGVSGIAFTVFLAILILLSIYFFVRINKYEKEIQLHGFNELNQLGRAVREKDKTLESVAWNLTGTQKDNRFLRSKGMALSFKIPQKYDSIYYNIRESESSMRISYSDFLKSLLKEDFLSDYILIKKGNNKEIKDTIVYSTFPYHIELKESDIFKAITKSSGKSSIFESQTSIDSISNSSIFQAGLIRKVGIQGKEYEMFFIPVSINNKPFYMSGFIEEKAYSEMKRGLDSTTIFIFVLVLGIILFSLPILKIFLMGPLEKLNRFNLTLAGISIVGGIIVVVVLTTITYVFFRSNLNIKENLKELNTEITDAFTKESEDLINQMFEYNDNIYDVRSGISVGSVLTNEVYRPQTIDYFKTFFWVDSFNSQIMQISTRSNAGALTNLSNREYVKNYSKWLWEDFSGEKKSLWYNIDPIFSNTSGEWLLAFSTPSSKIYSKNIKTKTGIKSSLHKVKLMGITSNMYSLHDPVLPDGYEYCLVDNKASVWFYSNNRLYINEDLITACNNSQRLAAAIHSGSDDLISVKLRSKTFYLYIKPIKNTELFMVTLCNPSGVKLFVAQAAFFSFVSLMLIFGLLFVFYIILYIIQHRKSSLAGRNFFFNWLLPNKSKENKYIQLFISNFLIALCLVIYLVSHGYSMLTPISVGILMASVIVLNFFFSYIKLRHTYTEDKTDWRGKGFMLALFVILAFIDVIAQISAGIYLFTASVVMQMLFFVIYKFSEITIDTLKKIVKFTLDFRALSGLSKVIVMVKNQPYIIFLFSWLTLSAVIPSFLIVKKTLDYEFRNFVTNQQISIAQQTYSRTEKVYKFFNDAVPVKDSSTINHRLIQGNYYYFFHQTHEANIKGEFKQDSSMYLKFSQMCRYYYNYLLGEKDFLEIKKQIIVGVNKSITGISALEFNIFDLNKTSQKHASRKVIASNIDYSFFNPFETKGYSLYFWLAAVLFLIMVILLLRLLIQKHFNFEMLTSKPVLLDECLKELKESKLSGVIVNINHDELHLAEIKDHRFVNLATNTELKDFEIPTLQQDQRLVVVGLENFEEINLFVTKLEKLVRLLDAYPNQLTIMLYTSPNILMQMYSDLISSIEKDEKLNQYKNQVYRIQKIFSNLPVLYSKRTLKQIQETGGKDFTEFIHNELSLDSYTRKLEPIILRYFEEEKRKGAIKDYYSGKEALILKIQELALPHYIYLWNNLSFSEKFVLFDLTQDTIVNLQNKEVLNSLLGKGILESRNGIRFTSQSLRNFILTQADKSELAEKQQNIMAAGNWNKLRAPLIIIAASIIVFLFATQISFLSNLYGILLSVGTLLGVFMRFSGMFKQGG